jgi:hypothetical protein
MGREDSLYASYKSGTMPDNLKSIYERGINTGSVALPQGVRSLEDQPQQVDPGTDFSAQPVSQYLTRGQQSERIDPKISEAIRKFKSNEYTPEQSELFKRGVSSGQIQLPKSEERLFQEITVPFYKPPEEKPSIGEYVSDLVTGGDKRTAETDAMEDWYNMPEIDDISMEGFQNAVGLMATTPEESVKILKNNSPGIEIRQDKKGNYIFKSAKDGKEYAIKPGLQPSDAKRAILTGLSFAATAPAKGAKMIYAAASAMMTQAAIEGSQAAMGGDFDVEQIPIAGATEFAGRALSGAKGRVKGVLDKTPSPVQKVVKEAEKAGIVPLTSDVLPPKTFIGKNIQSIGEKVPFGSGIKKAAQQEQRVEAVKDVFRQFGADDVANASDEVMKDVLKKHGADVRKYAGMKNEVIERMADTTVIVPVKNTNKAIKEGIEELSKRRTKEAQKAIDVLTEYGDAFQNSNLGNIEELRKELGSKLASQDMATVRNTAEKQLNKIYKAVNEDMGNFIKENGERRDFTKWKVANKKLSLGMKEMKGTALKSILKSGEFKPEVIDKLLFSKNRSEIKLLYKSLTPKGKNHAKIAVMQRAAKMSGGLEELSTAKFLTSIKKLENQTGIIFNNEDKKVLSALTKALKLTRGSETANFMPPTGVQIMPIATASILTSMLGGPVAGIGGTVGVGLAARYYESRTVRNILLQLSKAKPGKEQLIIKRLTTAVQAVRQQYKDEILNKQKTEDN